MKKFKKVFALAIASVMCMAAAACQTNQEASKTTAQSTADNGKKYTIAVVQPMDHPSLNQIRQTIISEFETSEYKDKVQIIEKNANGDQSLLPSIMQSLQGEGVDMIIPIATPAAQAAASAITDIPIVFSAVSNPVEAGLVKAFDQTDKNITGVSNSIPVDEIMALAKQITPEIQTFGFVYNPSEVNSAAGIEKAKKYCDDNNLKYKEATVGGTADIQQAAASLASDVDAFFTPNDNTVASAMATYLQVANSVKKPIYAGADSMVADGALATVGIDYVKLGKQTEQMAVKIMNGAKIAEVPVEAIKEYAKMINPNTAQTIGITIPKALEEEFVSVTSLD